MPIVPGQVIAYREKGKLLLGAILEDKGKKLFIISEKNDKGNITKEKIKHSLNNIIPHPLKTYEIIKEIQNIKQKLEKISSSIKLDELHSILYEENQGYTYEELADLYFENNTKLENILSMGFALSNDSIYFKLKNDAYYTKNKKQIEKELKEQQNQQLNKIKRKKEKEETITWIKQFISNSYDKTLLPPPVSVIKLLEPVKQYIILRDKFNNNNIINNITEELKKKANLKIKNKNQDLFNLLTKLEILKENDNLTLLKYRVPNSFKENLLNDAKEIQNFKEKEEKEEKENNYTPRKNLKHLFTFTIDDIETQDIDDALSLETVEEGYKLGIHITDVAHFIKPNSPLDKEAANRAMSIYLHNTKIPMFPTTLSENKLSLKEGTIRPALSFLILFNKNFQIIEKEITPSIIKIDKNMTYKEVEEIPNKKNSKLFETLYKIAKNLYKIRETNGAIEFQNPDIKIKQNENNNITLTKTNRNLISDLIIKETMILANYICAEFCVTNNIPSIYFYQEAPNEAITINEKIKENKYLLIEEIKKMKKSEVNLYPNTHFALGLPYYVQCTSPIRRYHDLIIHRQIKKYIIEKNIFYSKEEIRPIVFSTEEAVRKTKDIEKENLRYWTLKYLEQEQKKNRTFKATTLKKLVASYYVEIEEVITPALLITPSFIEPGKKIDVIISKVNPQQHN